MASKLPHSGNPGPRKQLYNKHGVKYSTVVYNAENLDKIPSCRLESEDIVIATYLKAG